MFWTDVVDTLPGSGLVGWCLESVFFADTNTSYNFYPAPTVNLGIDREGTAKSPVCFSSLLKFTVVHQLFVDVQLAYTHMNDLALCWTECP